MLSPEWLAGVLARAVAGEAAVLLLLENSALTRATGGDARHPRVPTGTA